MATIGLKDGTYKTSDGKTVVVKSGPKGSAPMPITRSTSGDELKQVKPGVYVSSGGKISRTTTRTPTPTPATEQTEANFSGMDGESYKVPYAKETPTTQKIPNTGITRELAKKGVFGTTSFAGDQSVEPLRRDPLANRPQYSSAYGYSTKTGYAEIFYEKKDDSEIKKEMALAEGERISNKLSYIGTNIGGVGVRGLSEGSSFALKNKSPGTYNNIKRTTSVAFSKTINYDRQLYPVSYGRKDGDPRYKQFVGGVLNSPNRFVQNPIGKSIDYAETASSMYFTGLGAGSVVEKIAVSKAKQTALSVGSQAGIKAGQKATMVGSLGLAGAGAVSIGAGYYINPSGLGESAPEMVLGGASFGVGYSGALSRPTTSYGNPKNTFKIKQDAGLIDGFTIESRQSTPVSIKQYGLEMRGTQTTKTYASNILEIGKTPTSKTYEVYATSQTKNTFNPKTALVRDYTGTATVFPTGSRLTLKGINNNQLMTSEFRGSNNLGTVRAISLVKQKDAYVASRYGFGISQTRLRSKNGVYFEGTSELDQMNIKSAETNLFNRGFKNSYSVESRKTIIRPLGRKGQIDTQSRFTESSFNPFEDKTVFRPREETLFETRQFTDSNIITRQKTLRELQPMRATPEILQSNALRIGISNRPVLINKAVFGGVTKTTPIANTIFNANIKNNIISRPQYIETSKITTTPDSITDFTPETMAKYDYTPIDTTRTIDTTPIPRDIVPPVFITTTGAGAIPDLYNPGTLTGGTRSKKRSYRYAPSLNAAVLRIKGSMPRTLTGLETRPLIVTRRKVKRGR